MVLTDTSRAEFGNRMKRSREERIQVQGDAGQCYWLHNATRVHHLGVVAVWLLLPRGQRALDWMQEPDLGITALLIERELRLVIELTGGARPDLKD